MSFTNISIHAPRTGSDQATGNGPSELPVFQSTLPARGATPCACRRCKRHRISIHAPRTGSDRSLPSPSRCRSISIHAPRTGSDATAARKPGLHTNFNPRSPHGERRRCASWRCPCRYFNPRSPHGERHAAGFAPCRILVFQSTLPARGATVPCRIHPQQQHDFNPRSPHGERQRSRT